MSSLTEKQSTQKQATYSPKIIGFLCNWCSYAGADKAGTAQHPFAPNVHTIRVMCSGRVDPQFILQAFQLGADGVLVLGCHPGDCHYKEQNYRALQRHQLTLNLLRQFGISEQRCRFDFVSASEGEKFGRVIEEMVTEVAKLGPTGIVPKNLQDAYPSWETVKKALTDALPEALTPKSPDSSQIAGGKPPCESPRLAPAPAIPASEPSVRPFQGTGKPLSPLGEKIAALPDLPPRKQLEELLHQSSLEEVSGWIAYLAKDLPPPTLEIVFKSIGRLGSFEFTPHLLRFSGHPIPRVRANLVEALEMNRDPIAVSAITGFLQDSDNRVRANAIKALGSFGDASTQEELERMTTDINPAMRSSVIYALSRLETPQAVSLLRTLLYDPEPVIRKGAMEVLAKGLSIQGLEALREYREMTKNPGEIQLVEKAVAELSKSLMKKITG